MPVFRSGKGLAPAWCELEYFEIINLPKGGWHTFTRDAKQEKLIVCQGRCRVAYNGRTVDAEKGANLDLGPDGRFEVIEVSEDAVLVRMCGRWGDEVGGSGVFSGAAVDNPTDPGDPVTYPKSTNFDNHFHDCDEYWIVYQGRALAVSEGKEYEIGPGDCLATGMGHHHDLPQVYEPLRAIYFETTMEGRKRIAHLWEHTHGPAEPVAKRV
jgi:mannose-6-phosphate isomerase-like protein (cupin superfamily)